MRPSDDPRPTDDLSPSPRTRFRAVVLAALGGLVTLIAMHGTISHTLGLGDVGGPAGGAEATDMLEVATGPVHRHTDTDRHGDGHPCPSCAQGAAALCALVVLATSSPVRRATGVVGVVAPPSILVAERAPAPDPPVPRFPLVRATT